MSEVWPASMPKCTQFGAYAQPVCSCKDEWPIHREAPALAEQSVEQEILITGIKVSHLLG